MIIQFRWKTISGEVVKQEKKEKTRRDYGGLKGMLEKSGRLKRPPQMETAILIMKLWIEKTERMAKKLL